MNEKEIREIYKEDTKGRAYHKPIITKRISAMVEEGTHCKISIIIEGITEKTACGFSTEVRQ